MIMAGIFDLLPEVGKLIDRFVPDPAKKLEAERMMRELDIREIEARMGVQKAWLSNNSLFVAGAIPTVLWMVSLVIFFNHILAPLLGSVGITVPVLDLPAWYSSLAGTVVLGLFGKKAWDSSEFHWNGETIKPAKEKIKTETSRGLGPRTPIASPVSGEKFADGPEATPPVTGAGTASLPGTGAEPQKNVYENPEEIDARLQALYSEHGIEP